MSIQQIIVRSRLSAAVLIPTLALLLTLALLAKGSVSNESPQGAPAYLHSVASQNLVRQSERHVNRRYTGIVSARQHANVGFEIGGKLARVLVDEGVVVAKGALLAMLDVELLEIEKTQLLAQIEETKSRLRLSQNNLKRQQSLKLSGFSSAQRLDELGTQERSLKAVVVQLQAAVKTVETKIRKAVLVAPFSGVVTRRFVDQGSVAAAGSAIVRLQQEGRMEAHVGVPVKMIKSIELEQVMPIQMHGQALEARVLSIGADIHPVTRTISVRLALPDAVHGVNGDLVYLLVKEWVPGEGFWVPADAITDGVRGLWRAYVLVPELVEVQSVGAPIFRIEARDIQVEYASESQVFIRGAVQGGERIVSGGLHRVAPGQRVRLSEQG